MRPLCLIPLLVGLSSAAFAAPGDVHAVINAATLRAGPGGQYPEVGTVSARNPVPLVEVSRQGGWIETDRGWIWSGLVSNQTGTDMTDTGNVAGSPSPFGRATEGSSAASNSSRMVISAYATDLRRAPKGDAQSDFRLSRGSEVTISRTQGDWARIAFGDATGWVLRSHLRAWEPSDAVATAAPVKRPSPRDEAALRGGFSPPTPVTAVTLAGY